MPQYNLTGLQAIVAMVSGHIVELATIVLDFNGNPIHPQQYKIKQYEDFDGKSQGPKVIWEWNSVSKIWTDNSFFDFNAKYRIVLGKEIGDEKTSFNSNY